MAKRSSNPTSNSILTLKRRLAGFLAERHPFAVGPAMRMLGKAWSEAERSLPRTRRDRRAQRLSTIVLQHLESELKLRAPADSADATVGVTAAQRLEQATAELMSDVEGFLRREALRDSLTDEERRELLWGMVLTRATDNQLKSFFLGGQVRWRNAAFQGKGFRSLGQEAIYAAALRLRRGADYHDAGVWSGDVVAPLIRDLGVGLAMRPDRAMVRMVLNAQMGKAGPPMDGRDFHIGDFQWGVLPASAPLSIPSLTIAGLAMAFRLEQSPRVALAFIGEGGASLGEWHEAINLCAARQLPAVFCIENNQTALSTPVMEQSAVRVFADKAGGYGIPGLTLDGTDPEAIAVGFAWAAERARAGSGPTLIEVQSMRMCGHAHHDDMLYLGREPSVSWDYPEPDGRGYVDREQYARWAERDPIETYNAQLIDLGIIDDGELPRLKERAERWVSEEAQHVIEAPWPAPEEAGSRVFADAEPELHGNSLEPSRFPDAAERAHRGRAPELPDLEPGPPHDPKGRTFLEAIMLGVGEALRDDPRVFVYGQDVGGDYGNAFLLLRPLLEEFGDRILNSTLAEGGILGVCVGSALAGRRPIGEIQFNDFVATGFNQLVNNAAKIRYRWGGSVPMVVRMPWGGLRSAGPYHSQNTEPWFYRTPGLKLVAPSTPHDARALLLAATQDPDPVLFYEHIALYREPRIKQRLDEAPPLALPLGRAALRRAGSDLAIISYGAYVHVALRVAESLAKDGIETSVLDLRSLQPLDREALLAVAAHCGKVLIAHEDSRRGGLGQSLAAEIQEQVFEHLDAPVTVVGALDAPVPYSPPLEEYFLPGEAGVEQAARALAAY